MDPVYGSLYHISSEFIIMNKDSIYMNIAEEYSRFSKCSSLKVGAILVNERGRIISTGVNGTKASTKNCCSRDTSLMEHIEFSEKYEIHAEMNLLLELIRNNININSDKLTIYTTVSPCWNCLKHILSTININRIIYKYEYHRTKDDIPNMIKFCLENDVKLEKIIEDG